VSLLLGNGLVVLSPFPLEEHVKRFVGLSCSRYRMRIGSVVIEDIPRLKLVFYPIVLKYDAAFKNVNE
jgi:hypothetical protein